MANIINRATVTSKYTLPDQTTHSSETTSDDVVTTNMSDLFTKVRTANKQYAVPNGEVEQVLTLTNSSDLEITNVRIYDTITTNANFKPQSMTINEEEYPLLDASDYTLPDPIGAGETVVVKYITVVENEPETDLLNIVSNVNYTVEGEQLSENSNVLSINIIEYKIEIKKTSDYSAVISGETMTFQNVISNTGNIKTTNLVFKDDIPAETTFITGSVKIDEVEKPDLDPTVGFELDDLDVGGQIVVSFKVNIK